MIYALITGPLARDPEQRQSSKGTTFATATLRSGSGDEAIFVNVVAFGEQADRLLTLRAGDVVSVSGRAELKSWVGKDGATRTGLSIVVSEVAAARPKPRPREAARLRRTTLPPLGPLPDDRLDDRLDDLYAAVDR